MKRNRIGVFILVFLLTTGFAAINTHLNLEGSVSLAMKSFSVRFNRAILNGANKTDLFNGDKTSIILQHKDISSQTESTLEYEIKMKVLIMMRKLLLHALHHMIMGPLSHMESHQIQLK